MSRDKTKTGLDVRRDAFGVVVEMWVEGKRVGELSYSAVDAVAVGKDIIRSAGSTPEKGSGR